MASRLIRLGWLFLLLCAGGCEPAPPPTHEIIRLGGESWEMELAVSEQQIERGLMHRETIPPGTGMLFLFDDSQMRSFWMGHCLTDMDLLFVDGMGRITAVHEMTVELPRLPEETERAYQMRMPGYPSIFPAKVAIELPPGTIQRLKLHAQQATGLDMEALEDLRIRAATTTR
ncbi:MAG: DUF192 domain-containing protein [Planctomycetota bacterium]|nr:DUF192 domain-containing protein [Planctomycetota bacterium]